ncbi:hypothetical protein PgNI_11434, partial [Pyricularia grisea]|uniref:Uncharacterized protein n=1 Tax=Pyricularia grisea TaxID=148305 RepID=A0A6P8AQ69_PYRGI
RTSSTEEYRELVNLTFPPRQSFGKSGALASSLASLALAFRLNVPEIPIGQQHWYAPHTRLLALLSVALIGEIYILCGKPKTYLQFRFWIKLKSSVATTWDPADINHPWLPRRKTDAKIRSGYWARSLFSVSPCFLRLALGIPQI